MQRVLQLAKALSDETRFRVVHALQRGELCVCELCDTLDVSQSTLSTHLQILRDAGLATVRRKGKWNYYALEADVARLLQRFFTEADPAFGSDKTLKADSAKLQKRLALRTDGQCCVGFTCCPPKPGKKR